jgi:lysozyme family protein
MSALAPIFDIIVGHEGAFSKTYADAGDWTSGHVGVGRLLGTNWGVDTASYPADLAKLDPAMRATMPATVAGLTRDQAQAIFAVCYWQPISGDALPPSLALLAADASYNNGPDRAARWLQETVGAGVDGSIGAQTLAALSKTLYATGTAAVATEFMAQRMNFMGGLAIWKSFGLGWSRRLAALPYQSLSLKVA